MSEPAGPTGSSTGPRELRLELRPEQREFHTRLLEHAHAPRYNYTSSDMLTADTLAQVRRFESEVRERPFWAPGGHPEWLAEFTNRAYREVPYYRSYGRPPRRFEEVPTCGRETLRDEPWRLVPDSLDLRDMTLYTTSGTSGSSLSIPTDPVVSSLLLVLLERLLEGAGVRLKRGGGAVAVALVAMHSQTLTYPSISHYLDGAGFVKMNLAPQEWRDPEDRAAFLRDLAPGVVTGSPYAFETMAALVPDLRPQALISSAVALHPGQARRLEALFECPVFDLYSMTEARAIGGRRPACEDDFALLSPDLYVEVLGPNDEPLGPGEVGEIVITGGRNRCLSLLRYRTGDRAALTFVDGRPRLSRFEGREETFLLDASGERVPTLNVVGALKALPLVGFSLVQMADRSVVFEFCGACSPEQVQAPLEALFAGPVQVVRKSEWEGKPHRFRSKGL